MKRLGNVFDRIASIENLELALRKASRLKKGRGSVIRTIERKNVLLPELSRMLLAGEYRTAVYHRKILYEPKMRTIYSLPFYPDRIVHHAVMNVLEDYWDARLIHDSYSCRKGKGSHRGSARCMEFVRRYRYCLQCDVSKFYQSVDHEVLRAMIRRKIKDRRLLILLDEVIDSSNRIPGAVQGKNVPIGNLISQWFGNLYMGAFDLWMKQERHVRAYVRYCDDFVVFSNDKLELSALREDAARWLGENLRLRLSKANVFRVDQGVDFLGFRHFPDHILLRKRTAKKIKRFARKFHAGGCDHDLRHYRGVAASYHGLLAHCQSYNLRKSLRFGEILAKVGISA